MVKRIGGTAVRLPTLRRRRKNTTRSTSTRLRCGVITLSEAAVSAFVLSFSVRRRLRASPSLSCLLPDSFMSQSTEKAMPARLPSRDHTFCRAIPSTQCPPPLCTSTRSPTRPPLAKRTSRSTHNITSRRLVYVPQMPTSVKSRLPVPTRVRKVRLGRRVPCAPPSRLRTTRTTATSPTRSARVQTRDRQRRGRTVGRRRGNEFRRPARLVARRSCDATAQCRARRASNEGNQKAASGRGACQTRDAFVERGGEAADRS